MIDLRTEELLTLRAACSLFPRVNGRAAHFSKVRRAADIGFKIGGRRVKLETVRVCNNVCTTAAAVERFIRACAEAAGEKPADEVNDEPNATRRLARALC